MEGVQLPRVGPSFTATWRQGEWETQTMTLGYRDAGRLQDRDSNIGRLGECETGALPEIETRTLGDCRTGRLQDKETGCETLIYRETGHSGTARKGDCKIER